MKYKSKIIGKMKQYFDINNEIIINGLKQKYDGKLKKLFKKDKIKNKLNSILGNSEKSKKLMKKLDKYFKQQM